ncbi:hypothetical protein VE03_05814 [Pseudogymnoascus sp. 23342-1-I1]|nr:hypothetical protein VE03_05814 [Pseudogymnoascus sp. 23342-1-I1]
MDHDTLGSRCFQKGDHLGALEHFNTAIKCSSPKLVPAILNKRSLVYIKLEKFQQALRDGREIIKRVPDMAMGYLRCGQIVQLMGQRDKALDILERGLQKIPVGNEDRKILSKHYEALRKQSQAANRLDPLPLLPQEIAQHIWGLLDLKSRGCCLSVSKGWKKSMESYPPLWQDLKIFNNKMPEAALTAWLKRAEHSGHNLRSATITSQDYEDKCRNYIKRVQRRDKLERLELHIASLFSSIPAMLPVPSQYLKTLVVSTGSRVDISDIKRIMAHYTGLERVEFHAVTERDSACSWPEMPNLQFIGLQFSPAHGFVRLGSGELGLAWNDLAKASPNMKSATIKRWPHMAVPRVIEMASWRKLTHLDISLTQFTSVPVFPTTLTHLEAERVHVSSTNSEFDQKDFFQLPKLEYLNVKDSDLFTVVNDMVNLALVSGSLKELHVGSNSVMAQTSNHNSWLQTLPAPSPALTTLSLRGLVELPEKVMIAILRQYPNLETVNLAYTGATGSTLRELFEREKKPRYVDMEGCDGCYYDAVEAARGAGIDVWHELAPKNKRPDRSWRDESFR